MGAQVFSRRTAIKMAVAAASVPLIGLVGCGKKSIVGTWANDDGDEILQFDENGDCSVLLLITVRGWRAAIAIRFKKTRHWF